MEVVAIVAEKLLPLTIPPLNVMSANVPLNAVVPERVDTPATLLIVVNRPLIVIGLAAKSTVRLTLPLTSSEPPMGVFAKTPVIFPV